MDLSINDIIKKPHISSKAQRLGQKYKQVVFDVHPQANKPMIALALKKLFNLEASKIRIVVRKGKIRRAGRRFTQGPLEKKAIISLKGDVSSMTELNPAAMPSQNQG